MEKTTKETKKFCEECACSFYGGYYDDTCNSCAMKQGILSLEERKMFPMVKP